MNIIEEENRIDIFFKLGKGKRVFTIVKYNINDSTKLNISSALKFLKYKLGCGGNLLDSKTIQLNGDHRRMVKILLICNIFDIEFEEKSIIVHEY